MPPSPTYNLVHPLNEINNSLTPGHCRDPGLYKLLLFHVPSLSPFPLLVLYRIISPSLRPWNMCGFVSTSPNPQAEGPPLVDCLRLLIQYIRSYLPSTVKYEPFLLEMKISNPKHVHSKLVFCLTLFPILTEETKFSMSCDYPNHFCVFFKAFLWDTEVDFI